MGSVIREVASRDAKAICGIYNPYVGGTAITFEQEPVASTDMAACIDTVTATYPWGGGRDAGRRAGLCLRHPVARPGRVRPHRGDQDLRS